MPENKDGKSSNAADRARRLAAELRANLRRRKTRERGRAVPPDENRAAKDGSRSGGS